MGNQEIKIDRQKPHVRKRLLYPRSCFAVPKPRQVIIDSYLKKKKEFHFARKRVNVMMQKLFF